MWCESHDIIICKRNEYVQCFVEIFWDCSSGINVHVFDIVYIRVLKNCSSDSRVVIYQCHEPLDVVFI